MGTKIFCAFSELEVRRHYREWRRQNPTIHIVRELVLDPVDGLGGFLGRTFYQMSIEFRGGPDVGRR